MIPFADPSKPVPHIGGYRTSDVLKRFESLARAGGYQIAEWLIPSADDGLRVVCEMKVSGHVQSLGFRWDGEDLNVLVTLVMALDLSMKNIPAAMARKRKETVQ